MMRIEKTGREWCIWQDVVGQWHPNLIGSYTSRTAAEKALERLRKGNEA